MNKWPDKLNICGRTYTIAYMPRDVTIVDEAGQSGWGQFAPLEQELRVFDSDDPVNKLDTLLHEILHAIFHHNRPLRKIVGGNAKEEQLVDPLASLLADTLTRNGLINLDWRKKKNKEK